MLITAVEDSKTTFAPKYLPELVRITPNDSPLDLESFTNLKFTWIHEYCLFWQLPPFQNWAYDRAKTLFNQKAPFLIKQYKWKKQYCEIKGYSPVLIEHWKEAEEAWSLCFGKESDRQKYPQYLPQPIN